MSITVITPSIRPDGLKMTYETLKKQTYVDFEWLPRLSIPGERSDLSYQMNQALQEAKGEIIVFLQDYIRIPANALEKIADLYKISSAGFTFPMVKGGKEDWRKHSENNTKIASGAWEIDFGSALRADIEQAGGFCELYDEGFGWENVDLAYRMWQNGVEFRVHTNIVAEGVDHDSFIEHPYRRNPNNKLWEKRKEILDNVFKNNSNQKDH